MAHEDDVQRLPPTGITVVVSGAGVGGLMTALECWRIGCNVRIFEKSRENVTSGDSFTIGHSAIRHIQRWPWMRNKVKEIVADPLVAYHDHTGKRVLGPMQFTELLAKSGGGGDNHIDRHFRPKFHSMLLGQLSRIGVEVEYGRGVVEYFEDTQTRTAGVVFSHGTRCEADLVVASDGGKSVSTAMMPGASTAPRSSGSAIYRVAYPISEAMKDPEVAKRFTLSDNGRPIVEIWVGEGSNAVITRGVEQMEWVIYHPDTGSADETWNRKVDPADVVKFTSTLEGWPEVGNRLIMTAPADKIVDWKLMWRDPQRQWTSVGGHIVQLGDAAHTFLPSSGNGATQALDDAISLAACVQVGGKEGIADATRVHNLLRFERVSCLQAWGVLNLDKGSGKNRDMKSRVVHAGRWMFNHDARAYAEQNYSKALEHLNRGAPFRNTNIPPGLEYRPWTLHGLLEALRTGEPSILDGDWS